MVKLTLTDLLSKQEIIDLWDDVHAVVIDDGEDVVFQLINNTDVEIDTYGFVFYGAWTPRTDDFLVLKWDKQIFVFEDKEVVRISIINKSEYEASRKAISTYDDMMIVTHDNRFYHETESDSRPLELVAIVNAPYHNDDDYLSGTFNFGEANISIYFDVSAEGDDDSLYYYFVYKEGSDWIEWEDEERADLIYEYETKIAKAKRNNDTETQYYYQDKLDELLREYDRYRSLIHEKEEE